MGVLILSGSPKRGDGASRRLGLALAETIERLAQKSPGSGSKRAVGPAGGQTGWSVGGPVDGEACEPVDGAAKLVYSASLAAEELLELLGTHLTLILTFPLYVDSLPSHLVDLLEAIKGKVYGLAVYAVVNCGFFEPEKNLVVIEILKNFCREAGLKWGRALAFGGGGMVVSSSRLNFPPLSGLGRELEDLAADALAGAEGPDRLASPNVPKWLYKTGAHLLWRWKAFRNGLKGKDLYRRLDG